MRGKIRAYSKVIRVAERYTTLNSIKRLMHWDERVMMNIKHQPIRSKENNALATTTHRHIISSVLGKNINLAKKEKLTSEEQITLKEIEAEHLRLKNVKQSLITAKEKATSKSLLSWKIAYEENNYSLFEKDFEKTIKYAKRYGKAINKNNPYEALLQDFESDLTLQETELLIEDVKKVAEKIIKQKQEKPNINLEKINISLKKRQSLGIDLAKTIGIDFDHARLDWSNKSFSTYFGRLAIKNTDWFTEVKTILHESGHSLYELGLPLENFGNPLCNIRSFAMDEAMAMIWEHHVGRDIGFWNYYLKKIKPLKIPFNAKNIVQELKQINKSIIRLEADEISYILHICLRFELEKEFINGKLKVKQIPKKWNQKIKKYFEKIPENFREGILQDIHWSKGGIGYFPNYIIGLIIGAQIFDKIKEDIPNLSELFAKGDFKTLKIWLDTNIHSQGKKYTTKELIKKVTGKELSAESYINYLNKNYSKSET